MADDTPRTAAGRALLEHMTEDATGFLLLTSGRFSVVWVLDALRNEIPRIEAEAAALDVDRLARAMDNVDPPIYGDEDALDQAEHRAYAVELAAEYDRLASEGPR